MKTWVKLDVLEAARRRYLLNEKLRIEISKGSLLFFAEHRGLNLYGCGFTQREALEVLALSFDTQWRNLIEGRYFKCIDKALLKRRGQLESLVSFLVEL
jgi:hypothetical protein